MRCFLVLLAVAVTAVGCGGTTIRQPPTTVDLAALVKILPTQDGLDFSDTVTKVDAAGLQEQLAGIARAESAKVFDEIGFRDGAIRRWSGPNGAAMVVVVSRWPDHQVATNVGGGAVQRLVDTTDAAAWTPEDLAGARGARLTGASQVRILSLAVADVSLLVRSDGPIDDAAVVRTMELLTRPVRAAASP